MKNFRKRVFVKASMCRAFEDELYNQIELKNIKFPVYLSAGQEYIPATIYTILEEKGIEPNIFLQHRGHSHYLSSGGDIVELIDELLGRKSGCSKGMGGSASIQSLSKKIYGHDGLMGSQVPISVGHAYQTRTPTVVVMGDASAEEDYVLSSLGWASTKNLPVLFIVEDNNLSILTEKSVRRNWEIDEVAKGFKIKSFNISDNPVDIYNHIKDYNFEYPLLLNIKTHRKYWHSGAGQDDIKFDRFISEINELGHECEVLHEQNKSNIRRLWKEQLEKQ